MRALGLIVGIGPLDDRLILWLPAPVRAHRLHVHPLFDLFQHEAAHGGDQQGKPNKVGKKPRCQQQRARKQDHCAMGQRFGRVAQIIKAGLQLLNRPRALAFDQSRARNRRQNHDRQCRPKPQPPADLNEQTDFDQRNRDKQDKQPHNLNAFQPIRGPFTAFRVNRTHARACNGLDPTPALHMCLTHDILTHTPNRGAMNSSLLSLLVLAGIAIFLILRLRSVLGTRDGFEKPPAASGGKVRRDFEVIEGGPDDDIIDHVDDGSDSAKALAAMKMAEPGFRVGEFLGGARQAYEMILMAFERGDKEGLRPFLAGDVLETFETVIDQRVEQGLTIEAEFIGVREISLQEATFDRSSGVGEVTVRFVGELTSVVRNGDGEIIEGDASEIKRQRDVWTFARTMGADDPNWALVATDG